MEIDRLKREHDAREAARLAAAVDVSDSYDGPVHCDGVSGADWGDGYFSALDVLVDSLAYDAPDERPEWAFACSEQQLSLLIDDAIEQLCDNGYDQMAERLDIPDSLEAAVDEFNRINADALKVYNVDYSRKVWISATLTGGAT